MKISINKPYYGLAVLFVLFVFFATILTACGGQAPTAVVETTSQAPAAVAPAAVAPTAVAPTAVAPTAVAPSEQVSYSKDIMPILKTSCVKCHGVEKVSRGLNLTTYEKMMNGSIKGPVVVPGNAEKSNLFSLAKQGKMPKQGQKLSAVQLEILKSWIDAGAQNN